MRTPINNPFEPGSDRVPRVWAGRQPQLADWRDRLRPRRHGGLYERGRTLLGEPGIGKSVLARRIVADAADGGDWTTAQIRIPAGVNPLPLVAGHLRELADLAGLPQRREHAIGSLLERVRQISAAGASVSFDPGEGVPAHLALTQLLIEIGLAADGAGRVAVVHLDEVQNVTDGDAMSQLLISFGDALGYEWERPVPGGRTVAACLPLVVYLTALPEFSDRASARGGATFARRFMTELLDPISDDDIEAALTPFVTVGHPVAEGLVTMTAEARRRIVTLCHGDPFVFQLAGQHAWDAGTGAIIDASDVDAGWERARGEARRHVERQLDRLPDLERAMVEAMAELAPDERTLTTIARHLGYERASQLGPTAQRLDTTRGIITRGTLYGFRARTVEAHLEGTWP